MVQVPSIQVLLLCYLGNLWPSCMVLTGRPKCVVENLQDPSGATYFTSYPQPPIISSCLSPPIFSASTNLPCICPIYSAILLIYSYTIILHFFSTIGIQNKLYHSPPFCFILKTALRFRSGECNLSLSVSCLKLTTITLAFVGQLQLNKGKWPVLSE